jgi:dienelactone hydrolase
MIRRAAVAAVLLGLIPAAAEAASSEIVRFPGPELDGAAVELAGRLVRPDGDGPFAAIVLLHGCDGTDLESDWVARDFGDWGYVFLELDSFGPRGVSEACTDYLRVAPLTRAKDAHAAQAYLATLPFVDRARIAVLGWSHGGMTVLDAIANPYLNEPMRPDPFAAAVAFYPYCPLKLAKPDAPLLVLIGDADDWTPVNRCTSMELRGDPLPPYELPPYELVVYPGATHAFDWPAAPETYFGHHLRYDAAAAEDAYRRIRAFLDRYLY